MSASAMHRITIFRFIQYTELHRLKMQGDYDDGEMTVTTTTIIKSVC